MQNVNKKENWVLFLVLLQVIGSQMSKPDSVRLRIYWESGRKKPSEMSKNWLLLEESDFKKMNWKFLEILWKREE